MKSDFKPQKATSNGHFYKNRSLSKNGLKITISSRLLNTHFQLKWVGPLPNITYIYIYIYIYKHDQSYSLQYQVTPQQQCQAAPPQLDSNFEDLILKIMSDMSDRMMGKVNSRVGKITNMVGNLT